METNQTKTDHSAGKNWLNRLFLRIGEGLTRLFAPEEVEVTFKDEGKKTTYTYTVIDHHHAA